MAKVTCQICKKKIEKSTAFKLEKNDPKKYLYYCSETEYNDHVTKMNEYHDTMSYILYDILEYESSDIIPAILFKRLKKLNVVFDWRTIKLTFEAHEKFLKHAATEKEFKSEAHKTNYLMTVVESEINGVYKKWKSEKKFEQKIAAKQKDELPLFIYEEPPVVQMNDEKPKTGIARFLEEGDM